MELINQAIEAIKDLNLPYLDAENRFAYLPLTSPPEQIAYGVLDSSCKVIIFDIATGYFNATHFINTFRDDPTKTITKVARNYKMISEMLINDMNNVFIELSREEANANNDLERAEIARKRTLYMSLPMWNIKKKYLTPEYTIANTGRDPCNWLYAGNYLHPELFAEVAMQTNIRLGMAISRMSLMTLLKTGANHEMTIDNIILSLPTIINMDEVQHKKILDFPNTPQIVKVEKKKKKQVMESNKNLAVLVKANYNAQYKYGSSEYCLSLMLVSEEDIVNYTDVLDCKPKHLTRDELLEQLDNAILPEFKSEIIWKVVSLRNVPANFIELFVSIYDTKCDLVIENGYIYTSELEEFKKCLTEFLGEWMII